MQRLVAPILERLEKRLQRFAVPNVTAALVAGQVAVYVLTYFSPHANQRGLEAQPDTLFLSKLTLVPDLVLAGEVWRVVTFLFVPPITNLVFAFFFWYLFYLMGTVLERTWGTFHYNIYLLVGYAATVAVSFLTPAAAATNGFVEASVFLAFAHLYPDFVLRLFFLLPVKIKWLALLTWIGYFWAVATGDWRIRASVLASVSNFLLFFGRDIVARLRNSRRRMVFQAATVRGSKKRVHCCATCGITSEERRDLDFRYCTQCVGAPCYCPDHIRNHDHVTGADGRARV
jgi:hypothetical protein